jgi:hypothetical protein
MQKPVAYTMRSITPDWLRDWMTQNTHSRNSPVPVITATAQLDCTRNRHQADNEIVHSLENMIKLNLHCLHSPTISILRSSKARIQALDVKTPSCWAKIFDLQEFGAAISDVRRAGDKTFRTCERGQ